MKFSKPPKLGILHVAEGYHIAHVVDTLESLGILGSLHTAISIRSLATRHQVNARILEAGLRFLVLRTNLLVERAGKFCVTGHYDAECRFLLHQYLGAFGRNGAEFAKILVDPSRGPESVDRRRHAQAFSQVDPMSANLVADVILQLGFNHLLDLGCGPGTLLTNLAARNGEFVGWGLDMNPWMCAEARKRIAAARARRRIRIFEGDCRRIAQSIPLQVRESVQTICAASLANEFFGNGGKDAIEWIGGLKKDFAGRILLLADYYGGGKSGGAASPPELALHDFVQAISGQGVPPSSLSEWKKIYRAARCRLVHAIELKGSPYFVHLLRL